MKKLYVDPDISRARTIATDVYKSQELFESSREKIFANSWQYIGDRHFVDEPGACYPFTYLEQFVDEPLLLTCDEKQIVRCLSNVCTHRGNILITSPCHSHHLKCKYHGRVFDLNGQFRSMPEFKEVKDFPSKEDSLHTLPLYQWGSLLFTTLSSINTSDIFFKDMRQRIDWLPLDEFRFRPELSKDFLIDANWALYCENYLEGFHIPFVHAGLNAAIDFTDYSTELFYPYSSLQLGVSKTGENCFDIPESSIDYGKRIAAYYFWVFPNMMFNFYPWGLSINVVKPLAVNKTKVIFHQYVWKEELRNRGAGAELDKVEMEDEAIVQQVQKGIQSRFYTQGRYSVSREKGPHHFHQLLAQFLH